MLRFANSERIFKHAMFKNHLLDVEKCSFMFDQLTDLDNRLPEVFCFDTLTIGTLGALFIEFEKFSDQKLGLKKKPKL